MPLPSCQALVLALRKFADARPPLASSEVADANWHRMDDQDDELTEAVERVMARAPMPAVAVGLVTPARVLVRRVHGIANLHTGEPVTTGHLWDLASLTKTLVTLPEVLSLVDEDVLALGLPLGQQWDGLAGRPAGEATLAQLLCYDAGLPASLPFFTTAVGGRDGVMEAALATDLEREPGSRAVYSDIGAIILGHLVSQLRGESLNALSMRRSGLTFGPVARPSVATEECAWRRRLIVGEVHDQNAAALGGEAGHAGAFGTLEQVTACLIAWMRGDVVSPGSHRSALREHSKNGAKERFGLSWWLANTRGLGGRNAGTDGWGMSGFVGNRIWVEPTRGYGVVVLSNRIHPVHGDRTPFNAWCDDLLGAVATVLAPMDGGRL